MPIKYKLLFWSFAAIVVIAILFALTSILRVPMGKEFPIFGQQLLPFIVALAGVAGMAWVMWKDIDYPRRHK